VDLVPDLLVSISVTSRPPRPSERPGVDYHFVTDAEFDRMIAADELLEWADVFGFRYGTPAAPIDHAIESGRHALLEIDVQGARQVRRRLAQAVLIFLEPPSLAELERRLRARGTEDDVRLARRLATAEAELGARAWFDHVVVNDDLDRASSQVAGIIAASQSPASGSTSLATGSTSEGPADP
jgi:guanylate kinase